MSGEGRGILGNLGERFNKAQPRIYAGFTGISKGLGLGVATV